MTEAMFTAFQKDSANHTAQYEYYPTLEVMPSPYAERRQDFGHVLGQILGIERDDAVKRLEAAGRN